MLKNKVIHNPFTWQPPTFASVKECLKKKISTQKLGYARRNNLTATFTFWALSLMSRPLLNIEENR